MGNITSCFHVQSTTAKLVDLHRNTLRNVDVPITAAELMLEAPGYVVSPMNDHRISAMKADESLCGGRVYVLISISRVNGKLSESEMAVIESDFGEKRAKRRSSRVIPLEKKISDGSDKSVNFLGEKSGIGMVNYRVRPWRPALEPIFEGH